MQNDTTVAIAAPEVSDTLCDLTATLAGMPAPERRTIITYLVARLTGV